MNGNLLVRNGTIIDPSQGLNGKYDIVIKGNIIEEMYKPGILNPPQEVSATVDATGCLVTPGLIDIHTHVFKNETPLGIDADRVGVQQGVTTVVDAGSAGANSFQKFLSEVIQKSETQVLSWINISADGLCAGLSELADLKNLTPDAVKDLILNYPEIRGIKVRMSSSVVKGNGVKPLEIAKKLAREIQLPIMVHIGNAPPELGDILDLLDGGDVVTHAFHGKAGGILDPNGELIPQAQAALKRGVLFDVGHGTSSFSFQTMQRALELNVVPHAISTDIYLQNIDGPVRSLTHTMSKLLTLGVSVEKVIEAITWTPAKILNLSDEIGTLKAGSVADVTVLQLTNRPARFIDSEGYEWEGQQELQPLYTIKSGKVLKCV